MRYLGAAVVAAACALAAASAIASEPVQRQVLIQARIAEVSAEARASLGVDWTATGGSYRSTSNEPPGSATANLLNGLGGVGGTLWHNTHLMPPRVGDPNGINVGVGIDASGFFGSDDDVLSLSRHNNDNMIDVILRRTINYTVDVTARASIPIIVIPRVVAGGSDRILFIEPFVGASVIGSETELMSDRTGIGGPNLTGSESDTKVGLVTGIGLITKLGKIPFLGDLPVLGGLFYKARHVPGSSASVTANGVTETGSVDSSWRHEALFVIITPFIVKDGRDGE